MVWLASGGARGRKPGQFWLDRDTRGTVYVPERQETKQW